ncbi:MAG: MFS transporter [Bacteroidetes bacterium]|nr:MAG: MFS transporter [Bacteroidota bacterium]
MFRYIDPRSYFTKVGFAFRALKAPSFRNFFLGQTVSLIGSFIQNIALGWLVYRLTASSFLLGLVGFAGQIPGLVLTPFAGVYADRLNRRIGLLSTQIMAMLLSLAMTILIMTDTVQIWHIILIAFLLGSVTAFDTPFRHAFLFDMVGDRDLLSNAVAMNSTMINTARFIGPMIGGALIASVGEGWCFLINTLSYTGIVAILATMRIINVRPKAKPKRIMEDLREGVAYSMRHPSIRYMLFLVASASLLGMPFQVFLPAFTKLMGGSATAFGYMTSAIGAGSLTGAFFLATRKSVVRFPLLIYICMLLFASGLLTFPFFRTVWFVVPILYLTGFGLITMFAGTNVYLQSVVDDKMRGRVIALYGMTFMGITPIGSLIMGAVSKYAGVPYTIIGGGALCLAAALLFRPHIPCIVWKAHLQD